MKSFRVMMDGERLHIVVDGYQGKDLKELVDLLSEFAMSKDGAKMTESHLEDFEPVQEPENIPAPPLKDVEPEKAEPAKEETPAAPAETKEDEGEAEKLYRKYLNGMKDKNENFIQQAFARDGGEMNFLTPDHKTAFGRAFKEWFTDRYKNDPFKGNIKLQKGFLKLYHKYIEEEIKSLEEQMGFATGTFCKSADNDQITVAYDICREAMLKRSSAQ